MSNLWKITAAYDRFMQELAELDSEDPDEHAEFLRVLGEELDDLRDDYENWLDANE